MKPVLAIVTTSFSNCNKLKLAENPFEIHGRLHRQTCIRRLICPVINPHVYIWTDTVTKNLKNANGQVLLLNLISLKLNY